MKHVILFLLVLSLISCTQTVPKQTTVNKANCIQHGMEKLTIRWGEADNKSRIYAGYEINSKGLIYRIVKDSANSDEVRKEIGKTDMERFCVILDSVDQAILKTQALNEPGIYTKFVEYSNPGSNSAFRAQWVNKNKTKNSRFFRPVYDSLQILADIAK